MRLSAGATPLLIVAVACGSGSSGDGNTDVDASVADADIRPSCADLRAPRSLGLIDPIKAGLQIHPSLGFDGETIWIAYTGNDVDNMSIFDTFVLRLDCEGKPLGSPIRATTTPGRSEIDPALAVGDDTVGVSWTSDTSGAENNLDIVVRTFGRDGTPSTSSDITIEPMTDDGDAVVGNAFFSGLSADPAGGFMLVGSNVLPGAPTFRAFANELDSAGNLVGALTPLSAQGPETHSEVSAVVDDAGTTWVTWTESRDGGDATLLSSITSAGDVATQPLIDTALASTPALATLGAVRVAAASSDIGGERDITIKATSGGLSASASIGTGGALDHSPALALESETRGTVAFYRNLGGFRNQLVVVAYDLDLANDSITFATPVEIAHETPAPPYAPAIAHIGGGLYLVVWAEGTSPEFMLRGEILAP